MSHENEEVKIPEGFHSLAETDSERYGGLCEPLSSEKSDAIHYPELHFHGKAAEHLKKHLKEHGMAKIHYRKVSEGKHTSGGKVRHSIGIQIHGIKATQSENQEKSVPKPSMSASEDAIEKGLDAASKGE
jgi:hypothetical protein